MKKQEGKEDEHRPFKQVACDNCHKKFYIARWYAEKLEKDDETIFCSDECRYNFETGNPGEEY